MQRREVLVRVQSIVRDELDDQSIQITETTAITDLPDWDSAAHVRILVALEAGFGILIDTEEFEVYTTLRDIVDCVYGKVGSSSAAGPETL